MVTGDTGISSNGNTFAHSARSIIDVLELILVETDFFIKSSLPRSQGVSTLRATVWTMNAVRNYAASRQTKPVAEEPVTSVLAAGEVPVFDRELNADEEVLAALGYKPEFKREFSLWTTFCVSFAVLGLLPSFASTLYYVSQRVHARQSGMSLMLLCQGMGYAGTPGMVWGWLVAMIFIQCVAMSMAELCSSMPTSGGLYYASAVLAPPLVFGHEDFQLYTNTEQRIWPFVTPLDILTIY